MAKLIHNCVRFVVSKSTPFSVIVQSCGPILLTLLKTAFDGVMGVFFGLTALTVSAEVILLDIPHLLDNSCCEKKRGHWLSGFNGGLQISGLWN